MTTEAITENVTMAEGNEIESRKRKREEESDSKKDSQDLNESKDESLLCPVCLDVWTNSGQHRLCSLRCGHLFGKSCVVKWLSGKKRGCPSCNAPSRKADIREIYATKLIAVDNSELENLRLECVKLQSEKQELLLQLNVQKTAVAFYKEKCEQNECVCVGKTKAIEQLVKQELQPKELWKVRLGEGSCRVLAYCAARGMKAVSQHYPGPLWPGYGVRFQVGESTNLSTLLPLHQKEIRDMSFHPTNVDLLLSVGFDNTAKVLDVSCNKVIFYLAEDHRLWSCCWDVEQSNFVYLGTERGLVFHMEALTGSSRCTLPLPQSQDQVKLGAAFGLRSSRRLRCLLCCRFFSFCAYRNEGPESFNCQLLQEGKFSAMAFNEEGEGEITAVLTCRPEAGNYRVRHACYRLEIADGVISCNIFHTILTGDSSPGLYRSCLLPPLEGGAGSIFFAGYGSMVCGWYVGRDMKVVTLKTQSTVEDLLAIRKDSKILLFVLMPHLLKCYELL